MNKLSKAILLSLSLFTVFSNLSFAAKLDIKALEQKANNNDLEAIKELGIAYYLGNDVVADEAKAMKWLLLSANKGDSVSNVYVGFIYYSCNTKEYCSMQKAREYYEKSTHSDALYQLGQLYFFGLGVEPNLQKAQQYYKMSADIGNENAKAALAMNLSTLNVSQEKARDSERFEVLKKSAAQGDPYSQYQLGTMYYRGNKLMKRDQATGVQWFLKAANQGVEEAQIEMGHASNLGIGVPKDYKEGFKWFKLVADKGNLYAKYKIAYSYYLGSGVEKNYKAAFDLYKTIASKGQDAFLASKKDDTNLFDVSNYINTIFMVGHMYHYGEGVAKNDKEAFTWIKKAADLGDIQAINELGFMYLQGEGTKKDRDMAKFYLNKACNQGLKDSCFLK